MGVSTDGIICLGIPFDEGAEFPWYDEEGYGNDQDALEAWWEGRGEKQELPVEMVNYCSGGVPMYVLAVKGSVQKCGRGYPHRIQLPIDKPEEQVEYMKFLRKHIGRDTWEMINEQAGFLKPELGQIPEPAWLLCSYWSA